MGFKVRVHGLIRVYRVGLGGGVEFMIGVPLKTWHNYRGGVEKQPEAFALFGIRV